MKPNSKFLQTLVALAATSPLALHAATYSWDGGGSANTSGNWSTVTNWNPDSTAGGPTTADTATLDNTGANRVVSCDAAATAALSTLQINQTSAFINTLSVQRAFTLATALTLEATGGGTSQLAIAPSSAALTVPITGGLTVNSGGLLTLGVGTTNGFGSTLNAVTTMNGGTISASAGATGSSTQAQISSLNMTGGNLALAAATGNDTRLRISNGFTATGGTIAVSGAGAGQLVLGGATNTISGTATFGSSITLSLDSGSQTLSSTTALGNILLRGSGTLVKTISSSAAGINIGQVQFINSTNTGSTTLQLGGDLKTGTSLPSAQNFGGQGGGSTGTVNFGIDTNGFALDLTSNTGTYTPNLAVNSSAITTNYTFSGAGRIKATSFTLSTASQVNVGAGTMLESTGTTAANILSGGGTINAAATFLYSGAATTGSPATLASTRSIGNLTVSSGALRISGSAITAEGLLTIGSNATLNLSLFGLTSNGLTFNNGLLNTPANLTIVGVGANVLKTGANTLVLSNPNNSYTGTTTVQDATLQFAGSVPVAGNSALGNASTAIMMGTASSTTSQRIQLYGTVDGSDISRAIDATGGTSVATDSTGSNRYRIGANLASGGTLTYSGSVTWGSVGALAVGRTLELGAVQLDTTSIFTGLLSTIPGSGGNLLVNGGGSGLGSVRLANPGNTFTNGLTVTQGTLLVGGNAPAGGVSVLGNNGGAISLGDGGTPASNWTVSGGSLNSGDAGNPAILTDGAFTVARAVSLSNVAAFTGGPAPTSPGNGSPNSYVIGGNAAAISTFSGNLTVATNASADKLLRLTQVAGGTVTLSGVINPNADASKVLDVEKIGAGKVILTGANTYDGDTTVTEGILEIGVASNFANASDIRLTTGSNLALTVSGTDTVNAFFIDGAQQASGKWGRTGSIAALGANNETALITGNGLLLVTTGVSGATYASYIAAFPGAAGAPGFSQDADNDGVANGVESMLGTNPTTSSPGLVQVSATTTSVTFRHSLTNTPASDVSYSYEWSSDLTNWFPTGGSNGSGTTATIASTTLVDNVTPATDEIQVTITITAGPAAKLFGRIKTNKL